MTSSPVIPTMRYLRLTISDKVPETLKDRSRLKKIRKCRQA